MKSPGSKFPSQLKWSLGALLVAIMLGTLLVQTVPFAYMAWGAVTGGPGIGLVQDMRQALLSQKPFREMLSRHEEEALARYHRDGVSAYQRRHLVRVNLTPLGLLGFQDIFAVRVRTDVVADTAYTSFLARPGVVSSPGDAPFFSRQCDGSVCKTLVRSLVGTGHALLRWGVITPFRLNITEMDATSSVSIGKEAISTAKWTRRSRQLHHKNIGRSFLSPQP